MNEMEYYLKKSQLEEFNYDEIYKKHSVFDFFIGYEKLVFYLAKNVLLHVIELKK